MTAAAPTPEGIDAFLDDAESRLLALSIESSRADWVRATYITDDTEALAAVASARLLGATSELAKASRRFRSEPLLEDQRRKTERIRLLLSIAGPADPRGAEELSRLVASMEGAYARGRHLMRGGSEPCDLQALSRILSESRDPAVLEDAWTGWHRVGRAIRPDFVRYVDLANRGARDLGFDDTGTMWRSKYEMTPTELEREVERLWKQVEPLYRSLHAYVRHRLVATYGAALVPGEGPIPAHLLGDMWAQSWTGIYPLLAPPGPAGASFDLTKTLVARGTTPTDMVRHAERFFVSLGLDPLPPSFWERSMLERPRDREVVCHASAWDIDLADDLRIKMCTEITADDFATVHHELGHAYYYRAYSRLPFLYRDSAHDGFHEALGDTIALSVTPEYLGRIGLYDPASGATDDRELLLRRALEKVAFLPFGLAVDRWRWRVFAGEVPPAEYNGTWWEMRREYQGIAPPAPRGDDEFDAGAKYHVPASVPYLRYFLAHILQFQFHRALVREAGGTGPLHRSSIHGSTAAGRRLKAMMELGASRGWPDALEAVTGERRMDAAGLLEYFAPLKRWLDEENRGHPVGW
jgi:peptidyl-dipeptidase A